jgi:hypothetical protein
MLAISRDVKFESEIYGSSRRQKPSVMFELVVVRRKSDQQLRPTIFIMSEKHHVAERLARVIRNHPKWKAFATSFDVFAYNNPVWLL